MEWAEVLKVVGATGGGATSMVLGWWSWTLWNELKASRVTCAAELTAKDNLLAERDECIARLNEKLNALQETRITDLKAIVKPSI